VAVEQPELHGLERAQTLWRLYRNEPQQPEPFYRMLAAETVRDLERRYGSLAGRTILDLGCGPGYYTDAFRAAGARVLPLDGAFIELDLAGDPPPGAVLADAGRTPLADASVDGAFCSNLLEHTPDATPIVAEMERVLKPGGWGYLSWTNWYSPHGGHFMSPYHLLGTRLGPRVYERLKGPPPKHRYGETLWAVHIGPTLRLVGGHESLEIESVEPRYWPWARPVMKVPGVREVAAWNCVIRTRKRAPDDEFDRTWKAVADVEGWLTTAQARRLWDRAAAVKPPGQIVEIGSYRGRSTIVLASASPGTVDVVAIDPHAGNDRGPQQWDGTAEEGQSDFDAFHANLRRVGLEDHVRHVRQFSGQAHGGVRGDVEVLFVDGAHRYTPARDDILRWGARVRPGGTMLVHDSFSSVGVTLALLTAIAIGTEYRYVGRSGSLAEFRREPVRGTARVRNALRLLAELPWFVRNLTVKVAIVAGLQPVARLLGHREGPWPY
jgi:SAM-dependent methyltransferase